MTLLEKERKEHKNSITCMNGDFLVAYSAIAYMRFGAHVVCLSSSPPLFPHLTLSLPTLTLLLDRPVQPDEHRYGGGRQS